MNELLLFLAQIPEPGKGEIEKWLIAAASVMAIIALAKGLVKKDPPDHKQYADKKDTERRLEALETRQRVDKEELLDRISEVPAETVALLKQTKGLL